MLHLFILVIIELLVLTCMIVFDIIERINYINTIKHYKELIKTENDMRSFVDLRDNLYQERQNLI